MSIRYRKNLDWGKVSSKLQKAGKKGLQAGLEILLEESQRQVPKDTGALAQSGKVVMYNDQEGHVSYNTEYALVQHERTDFSHPHGGKAKYLEDPANDSGIQSAMYAALGEAIRGELG
ncbi:MAG: HK97 gp10 family phage protein [Clostridia bacterium]|nr:HK97 gp10 family phage protein [Clostridia bacterium]